MAKQITIKQFLKAYSWAFHFAPCTMDDFKKDLQCLIDAQRKKDFEAGWKACWAVCDPMIEMLGAEEQMKADFEQYINPKDNG